MSVFDSLMHGLDEGDRDRALDLIRDRISQERHRAEGGDAVRRVDRGTGLRRGGAGGRRVPARRDSHRREH
ncbi:MULTISPECIES: hypothetical protein [Protofrankia]|uniref:Uncharacterized protein n=1 Tax=Candidatus Protofrankia datiscae TaxID=2716812 RepID=F8B2S4_9ACTN|nr:MULTISPECIES: hypothetical protein [Protofrankia]AEH07798.1 hypothetical protein FsymDg_0226 [Candidatus Protofrankia datiscae]